jgi:hypothetical protein
MNNIDDTLYEIADVAIDCFRQRMTNKGMVVKHVTVNSKLEFTRVEAGVPYFGNTQQQPCLEIKLTIEELIGPAGEELPYSTEIQYELPYRVFADDEVRNTFKYTKSLNVKNYSEKEQKIFAILYVLIRGYDYVKTFTIPKMTKLKREDIENYVVACVYDAHTTINNI